jgi:putative ABC transport system substrate-binding protein
VVFHAGIDPVRAGLVASLNRPGGNVTGVTFFTAALEPKRLGLQRELIPHADMVAVLLNPNYPDADVQLKDVQEATREMGQRALILTATMDTEIDHRLPDAREPTGWRAHGLCRSVLRPQA